MTASAPSVKTDTTTTDTSTDIHGVFVEADGDYYGPFATLDDARTFARAKTDPCICELDLHLVNSQEITREEYETEYAKRPQLIDPPKQQGDSTMDIATSVKTETVTADIAYVGDRVVRVGAAMRCPRCLRGWLRASGVCEIGDNKFAWRCGHCHADILTITSD